MKNQAVNDMVSHWTDNRTQNKAYVFPNPASCKTDLLVWALEAD